MSFSPKLLPPPVCAQPFLRLVSQYVSSRHIFIQILNSTFLLRILHLSEVLLHLLPPPPTSSFSSLSLSVLFCSLQLPDTLLISSPIPLPIPLFLLSLILCSTSPLFSYFLLLIQSLLYEELPPMCQELKVRKNIGFT